MLVCRIRQGPMYVYMGFTHHDDSLYLKIASPAKWAVAVAGLVVAVVLLHQIFASTPHTMSFRSVNFEVFGIVQGVFFRKFTRDEARRLELRGWCRNTRSGTVDGVVQGDGAKVEQMKHWLQHVGSPESTIEKAVFTDERTIDRYEFDNFSVRH